MCLALLSVVLLCNHWLWECAHTLFNCTHIEHMLCDQVVSCLLTSFKLSAKQSTESLLLFLHGCRLKNITHAGTQGLGSIWGIIGQSSRVMKSLVPHEVISVWDNHWPVWAQATNSSSSGRRDSSKQDTWSDLSCCNVIIASGGYFNGILLKLFRGHHSWISGKYSAQVSSIPLSFLPSCFGNILPTYVTGLLALV